MAKEERSYFLAGLLAVIVLASSLFLVSRLVPGTTTEAAPAPQVGMKQGERYHAVHVDGLQLRCDSCHSSAAQDYYDPMAQVSNPVDKKGCLSCHGPGSSQPFYGGDWQKAKVSR